MLRELLESGIDSDDLRAAHLLVSRLDMSLFARRRAIQVVSHALMLASQS